MTQHDDGQTEQQKRTDPFFGTWVLDPTQSDYEYGTPPQSGTYRIEPEGVSLKFTMEWVAGDGQHTGVYYSIPDGKDHPYENPAIADTVSTTRVNAHRLDTTSKKNGQVIAYASRVLSTDGTTMTVTQIVTDQHGQQHTNVSVYKKL